MKFEKAIEYDESGGCWWVNSINSGPIEVSIKVYGDESIAKAVAIVIEKTIDVESSF